jgi:hypothetical protein
MTSLLYERGSDFPAFNIMARRFPANQPGQSIEMKQGVVTQRFERKVRLEVPAGQNVPRPDLDRH